MYTLIIINLFEIVAAITGTIYITRYRKEKWSRYLVIFLWITIFMELTLGWLPAGVYYLDIFDFLKGTILEENIWVYNVYDIVSFMFYFAFFSSLRELKKVRRLSFFVGIGFVVFAIMNLIFSGSFFIEPSSLNFLLGSIFLLFHIIYFFFQILQSEKILDFYKLVFFYVAVGTLIFSSKCFTNLNLF